MSPRTPLLTAIAAALVLSASAASAQPAPQAGAPYAQKGERGERMKAHMQQRMEQRMAALRQALNLRPDQEAAFSAYQASLKAARPMDRAARPDKAARAAMTTPQRLDMTAERMERRQAVFAQHAEATKRFYAVLSPEQRKTFDALPQLMGREGKGPGRGRG